MKIIALIAAGALAATGLTAAAPAEARRGGWNDGYRDGRGIDRGWRHGRRFDRGWRGNRGGFQAPRNRGYYGGRGYSRPRVVCRIQRGWYGPERVCFRR